MNKYYVYILKCSDNSYYTGVTNNLENRLYQHSNGLIQNCYTYKRRPFELKYFAEYEDIRNAIEIEKKIKKWSRSKKEALIVNNWDEIKELAKCRNLTNHSNYTKS